MLNSISHRGPDHTKIIDSKEFTGGYVRLSINDLKYGSQPFKVKKKKITKLYLFIMVKFTIT